MTPPDNTKRPNELHILQARLLQLQRDREELQRLLRECPAYILLYQFSPKDTGQSKVK